MPGTRRIDCHTCDGEVRLPLVYGFDGADVACPHCGAQITDHALALRFARDRLTLAQAKEIAARYSYDEHIEAARRCYDADAASPEDLDVVAAFILLRHVEQDAFLERTH
jgi:hypothetical protein